MGIGSRQPLESPVLAPWAGEKGWGTWAASRCSSHPPGNLKRPCQPGVPGFGKPHAPPKIKYLEKGSKGGTQNCRVVAVGKGTGTVFKRFVLTKFCYSAEILTRSRNPMVEDCRLSAPAVVLEAETPREQGGH